jgi:hypothetical protein
MAKLAWVRLQVESDRPATAKIAGRLPFAWPSATQLLAERTAAVLRQEKLAAALGSPSPL